MGHSRQDKAASHDRIVAHRAGRFREAGVGALSVAELMQEAGLTMRLLPPFRIARRPVAEALEEALAQAGQHRRGRGGGRRLRRHRHRLCQHQARDGPATGCAVASLASEAARLKDESRAALTRHIESSVETFLACCGRRTRPPPRRRAAGDQRHGWRRGPGPRRVRPGAVRRDPCRASREAGGAGRAAAGPHDGGRGRLSGRPCRNPADPADRAVNAMFNCLNV